MSYRLVIRPSALADVGEAAGWYDHQERAWALISQYPAEIMRLPDRGTLTPGRRADLVIVQAETRQIVAPISGGALAYLSPEAAGRFAAGPVDLHLAAE